MEKNAELIDLDPYLNKASSIWLNPTLFIDKQLFIWKEWVEKGILILRDLYRTNTLKSFDAA